MLPIGVPGPTRQISSLSDWFSILISSLAPLCADLRCDLRDVLALESRAFEIELRRLAAAVATRDGGRPVRGVAHDLGVTHLTLEGIRQARDHEAQVHEHWQERENRRIPTPGFRSGRSEH